MIFRFWYLKYSCGPKITLDAFEIVNTSAPWLESLVAIYLFAPFTMVITMITEATPITTPISVSTVRILLPHSDCSASLKASINCIVLLSFLPRIARRPENGYAPGSRCVIRFYSGIPSVRNPRHPQRQQFRCADGDQLSARRRTFRADCLSWQLRRTTPALSLKNTHQNSPGFRHTGSGDHPPFP